MHVCIQFTIAIKLSFKLILPAVSMCELITDSVMWIQECLQLILLLSFFLDMCVNLNVLINFSSGWIILSKFI